MAYFVTGGTGFIGRRLERLLEGEGDDTGGIGELS